MGVDAQLGRASVAIRGTLDKLDSDLSAARGKVDSAVQRMASGAGKQFQQIGKIAMGAIGGATAAVAGLAGALGKIALDAAPVEGVASAFEGLAESVGYGQSEMLSALQEGSSGMIAQRDLMLSFNKASQLVSTEFAATLPDAMQYLSKVSASTGEDMGFMMDSLVTGVGRMSPMILDNLGIQVKLSEATERASEMYGLQAEELSEAQKQAGMTAVVMDKLAENTASMPDVSESAAAKMAQLKAQIQDAKDEIGLGFLPVLAGLLSAFMPLIQMALPVVVGLIERLTARLAPVTEALAGFTQRLANGTDPLTAFKVLLMNLLPPEMFAKVMEIVAGIQEFIGRVQEVLKPVGAFISENVELQDVLIVLGAAIASVVLPALGSVVVAVAPVIAAFVAAVAIVAAMRAAWEKDFLGIRTAVEKTVKRIEKWWAEHGDQVTTIVSEFIARVKENIEGTINAIRAIVKWVLAGIRAFWDAHGAAILQVASNTWDSIMMVVDTIIKNVQDVIAAVSLAIEGDWEGFGERLREIWDRNWETIKTILSNAWDSIKAIVKSLIANVIGFFQETDWGAVGTSIIDGIADGISAAASKIAEAAKSAAEAALDAAKGFLGIDSPSKVAAAEIGDPYAQGIGQGIEQAIPRVVRAARSATAQMLDAARLPRGQQMARPQAAVGAGLGLGSVTIYGLTLEGVQDAQGLLAELQRLS